MKDEHDTRTNELPELPTTTPRGVASAERLAVLKYAHALQDGQRTLGLFRSVANVAHEWGVSARRVRALLASGRLLGRQLENGYWEVRYPYTLTEGTRGPQMQRHRLKKPELMVVQNGN